MKIKRKFCLKHYIVAMLTMLWICAITSNVMAAINVKDSFEAIDIEGTHGHTYDIYVGKYYNETQHYEKFKCSCGAEKFLNYKNHIYSNRICMYCGYKDFTGTTVLKCSLNNLISSHSKQTEVKYEASESGHKRITSCKLCKVNVSEEQQQHNFATRVEIQEDSNEHWEIWECLCGKQQEKNRAKHKGNPCSVCQYKETQSSSHTHNFVKVKVQPAKEVHYELWECSCGVSEKRNQESHKFTDVDYKEAGNGHIIVKTCLCGESTTSDTTSHKGEVINYVDYTDNGHNVDMKCSLCDAKWTENDVAHKLNKDGKCECGFAGEITCKHNGKTKLEIDYKDEKQHLIKAICEECGEVIKEGLNNHDEEIIKIVNINSEIHTKMAECQVCNKKYSMKEDHVFDKKGMCKCGAIKDNEDIKLEKIEFVNENTTAKNTYSIKVGETIDLLQYIKVTPSNANVKLSFAIVAGEDGVAELQTYTGKLEAKKVYEKGIKVRIIDSITNIYDEATIIIKTNPQNEEEPETKEPPEFDDIQDDAWYEEDVKDAVEDGLFNGTSENTFSPDSPITRGMFVTVLARLDKADIENFANVFDDVKEDKYYQESVSWAVANGIVQGIGDGKFAPDAQITREAMAVIIYNYINLAHKGLLEEREDTTIFTDQLEIASWAEEAVRALKSIGLVNGKSGGNYKPKDAVTRAEGAVILQRLSERIKTDTVVKEEQKCSANLVVTEHREKLIMKYKIENSDTHTRIYECGICKTEWVEKTSAHTFTNAKCVCGYECAHTGSTKIENGYNNNQENVERTICEACNEIIKEEIKTIAYSNYSPEDFGQDKPKMAKNTYTEEDWVRMEAELKARVEKAGFGTRAGAVEAALYLASLDYAVPYRGTPMQREKYIGAYPKIGLNRTWGTYVQTTKAISYNGKTYEKGYNDINGMDCGAFVSWAMVNGGVKGVGYDVPGGTNGYTKDPGSLSNSMKAALGWSNIRAHALRDVADEVEPGDIALTYGYRNDGRAWTHVGLVVGVDKDNIYVAEENTTTYNPETNGYRAVNKLVVTRVPKTYKGDVLGWIVLCDDTLYSAKNPDGTENKGNMPIVWQ